MSNGHRNRRREWFEQAYGGETPQLPTVPTPVEAQAMVDQAVWSLGIDPQRAADPDGWRHLLLGTAHGVVNVVEWAPGLHFLVVWSPLVRAPEDPRLRVELFETLLRLNHQATGTARICLVEDLVVLSVVRPIHGLDLDEVLDAIRTVMMVADQLDGPLQNAYEVLMPQIDLDGEIWQGVLDVFRLGDEHARLIFKQLLEGWVALDGTLTTNRSGIGLRAIAGGDRTLAALIGYSSAGPQVTVGWDSLGRQWGLQEGDEAAFKGAVPRPARFRVTASLAHLPVDESFTEEMATQLLDALIGLDRALTRATRPPKPPLPDLEKRWGLAIRVGGATRRGINALLGACSPDVRDVYRVLIEGWHNAGLQLYTHTPDRVALRLTVDGHTFGLCTLYGPHEPHGPRIELYYPLIYYFEKRDEARWRYEGAVARISQFRPHLSGGRIVIDETFTAKSADALLTILCRLAEDVDAAG